jgi:hypothetical protein
VPPRSEPDGADEVVELAVSLPVDDPACLTLCGAPSRSGAAGSGSCSRVGLLLHGPVRQDDAFHEDT